MKKTLLVLGLFLGALALGLFTRFNVQEPFMQQDIGKPLNSGGMGPYDETGPVSGWLPNENSMPVGTQPVAQAFDSNKLMYLVNNKTDPSCCPSAFSTDSGCVCLSGKDTDLMNRRGGNK
jgi:hypothetical protein